MKKVKDYIVGMWKYRSLRMVMFLEFGVTGILIILPVILFFITGLYSTLIGEALPILYIKILRETWVEPYEEKVKDDVFAAIETTADVILMYAENGDWDSFNFEYDKLLEGRDENPLRGMILDKVDVGILQFAAPFEFAAGQRIVQ